MNTEIKVRKPKQGFWGILNRNYRKKLDLWKTQFPNNGEKIKVTWFPDNRGEKNAYIGWEGVVEKMNKDEGTFCLNSGNAILICHGNFDYIKL